MRRRARPGFRDLARKPLHLAAFGFGSGLSAWAPGTAGTLVGVLVYVPLSRLGPALYMTVVLVLLGLGVWICEVTARELGVHDDPGIVWDEIVGYLLTMAVAPSGWAWMLAGFVAFRLFDILKPWPIRLADRRVPGGLGIMLDDVLAAAYAAACLALLDRINLALV